MSDKNMPAAIDYAAIGNLVKSWVLGEDRLKRPDPADATKTLSWAKPVSSRDPAVIEALRQQFQAAGTAYVIPAEVTELVVVESSATRFVLKLPSPDSIKTSEAQLATQSWIIPAFYDAALGQAGMPSVADRLILDAQRIGDHTISNCAG